MTTELPASSGDPVAFMSYARRDDMDGRLTAGAQAVIAYQYPVRPELARKFNVALYSALADGTPLEMAAQLARKKVWSSDSEGRAFLSPAVFVRNPGGLDSPLPARACRGAG